MAVHEVQVASAHLLVLFELEVTVQPDWLRQGQPSAFVFPCPLDTVRGEPRPSTFRAGRWIVTQRQVLGSCHRVLLEPALMPYWLFLKVLASCPRILLEPALFASLTTVFKAFS